MNNSVSRYWTAQIRVCSRGVVPADLLHLSPDSNASQRAEGRSPGGRRVDELWRPTASLRGWTEKLGRDEPRQTWSDSWWR